MPDPFDSADKLKSADNLTCKFVNDIIIVLSDKLNKKLGLNYSLKFWKIILNPWLIMIIQAAWERQLRVQKFINNNKHKKNHRQYSCHYTCIKDSATRNP